MATVINTYAGAFADVVMSSVSIPRNSGGNAVDCRTGAPEQGTAEVWENPSIPAGEKRGVLDAIVRAGIFASGAESCCR
jgi:hypothetical protein